MLACVSELVFESLHAIDILQKEPNPIIRFELSFWIRIVWDPSPSDSVFSIARP